MSAFGRLYRELLTAEAEVEAAEARDDFKALRSAERACSALQDQIWEMEQAGRDEPIRFRAMYYVIK